MATKDNKDLSVGEIILAHKSEIADAWLKMIMNSPVSSLSGKLNRGQLKHQVSTLLETLTPALHAEPFEDTSSERYLDCKKQLRRLSGEFAKMNISPSDTARFVLAFRDVLLSFLQREYRPTGRKFNSIVQKVNGLVDDLSLFTLESYMKSREILISQQSQALLELSTPVVKLWKGILLIPLIGVIDTVRANQIVEKLLQKIVDTECRVAILDVTGVPVIDTKVAHHLVKTTQAAKLLGAEIILTGINPNSALTLTKLQMDLGEIITRGSLMSGVNTAFKMLQLGVQE